MRKKIINFLLKFNKLCVNLPEESMNLIISIHPQYAQSILDGSKRYEYRKMIPIRNDIDRVYIYATKPIQAIIGEFTLDGIISDTPQKVWDITARHGGITEAFFNDYFKSRNKAYALKVGDVIKYDVPIDPKEVITDFTPPQNFMYEKNGLEIIKSIDEKNEGCSGQDSVLHEYL